MSKTQTKKKKSTWVKVVSIFVDILVIPVIILAFICTILTFSAKANNKVPQIFGKSIVTVLSDSMEPKYKVGDVLVITKVDVNSLKVGDNIAFYAPIWLNSPFTSTVNGKKVSNIIYHQIVDIIYVQNGSEEVRHFVCRGTNVSHEPGYVYVGEGHPRGNYKKTEDGNYVMSPGTGDYAIVLEDLTNKNADDLTTNDIQNSKMPTMQYITDEYVVGVYDSSLSPAIGGFIKFASSSMGLSIMVIVPAALMIVYVIFSMVKDVKTNKEEEEQEELVLEGNISKLKETSATAKIEAEKSAVVKKQPVVEEKKAEELDLASVISGAVASRTGEKSQETAKKDEKKTVNAGKKVEIKQAGIKSSEINDISKTTEAAKPSAKNLEQNKPTSVKPVTSSATGMKKVPEVKSVDENKAKVPSATTEDKKAPVPKKAPISKTTAGVSPVKKTPTVNPSAQGATVKKAPSVKSEPSTKKSPPKKD